MKCNGMYAMGGKCWVECGCGLPGCPVMHTDGLSGAIQDVVDFHDAMGQPVHKVLTTPTDERVRLRANLILEECKETVDAMFDGVFWQQTGVRFGEVNVDHVALADGLADLIYVCIGAANEFGIDLAAVWQEVHKSNMAKIGPNGEVKRRADGKVIKPEGWTPPDVAGVLNRNKK